MKKLTNPIKRKFHFDIISEPENEIKKPLYVLTTPLTPEHLKSSKKNETEIMSPLT